MLVIIASVAPSGDLALEAVHEPDPVYSIRSNSSISPVAEIGAMDVMLEYSASTVVLDWDITSHLALKMALRLLARVVASLLLPLLPLLDEVLERTDSSADKESTFSILSFEAIHLPPCEASEDDENDPADSFQESGSVPSVLLLSSA